MKIFSKTNTKINFTTRAISKRHENRFPTTIENKRRSISDAIFKIERIDPSLKIDFTKTIRTA